MSGTSRAARPRGGGDARVLAFDGLRGVALLLVMIYHVNRLFPVPSPAAPLLDRVVAWAAQAGWCGVDLFFVLSGFLVTRLLRDARAGSGSLLGFYGRRALRIVPA